MTIRVAVVGLGKIARDQHLPAIAATPGIELAAIVSRNASLSDLPSFPDLASLFRTGPEIDAVSLCTPPVGRRTQATIALEAGKHVMLEKPPGATVSEIRPLCDEALRKRVTLFATWHSRFAPAVEPARSLLATRRLRSVRIDWREDVRVWHPGQTWIFEPGGLGVFDPGINALSILTGILPNPPFVTAASLDVPANKHAPIAATIDLEDTAGLPIRVELDFLQTGPQTWDIKIETDAGDIILSQGGARLSDAGQEIAVGEEAEYRSLYARFVELVQNGTSEADLSPLQLVADAFLLGKHQPAAPFQD